MGHVARNDLVRMIGAVALLSGALIVAGGLAWGLFGPSPDEAIATQGLAEGQAEATSSRSTGGLLMILGAFVLLAGSLTMSISRSVAEPEQPKTTGETSQPKTT